MTKEEIIKEPVRIRRKQLSNGNVSLYLDIYRNGRREYEFLKLYLGPEKTREDRERNRETMRLANSIKAQRIVSIQNGEFGFRTQRAEDVYFLDYYNRMCAARQETEGRGNWGNWTSCRKHLLKYDRYLAKRTFAEIDREWVQGFRDYLEKEADAWSEDGRDRKTYELAQNSRVSYFNKLKACLRQAFEDRIIADNPAKGVPGFKAEEGTRMYLTIDEIRRLANTECDAPEVRRAFLFSCLTGLRRSDIQKLTWGEVHKQGRFTRIIFKQKKTGGLEYLDLTPQAADLIGERSGGPADKVFGNFFSPSSTNSYLKVWCARAGIDKPITFHCGRHSFATLMLDLGTDIYTVSKLLGHRELSTTQIYAKVLDKNKQAAVSSIPDILAPATEDGGSEKP